MKREYTDLMKDGFSGCFYEASEPSGKCVIVFIGDHGDNIMNKWSAKYLNALGCHVLGIGKWQEREKRNGIYEWKLEYVESAVKWLRAKNIAKIGMMGGSFGGNLALTAASLIPDISFVSVFCPCDIVLEGFQEGKKDGMGEWCTGTSSYTWRGEPLPYQPYFLTEREYWDTYRRASKKYKELNSREIFIHSEKTRSVPEECFIKIENIKGKILMFAAEDDSMWETAKYVRRMEKRLKEHHFAYPFECHVYKYGTHFIFPQSLLTGALPVGSGLLIRLFASGRKHPKECRESRIHVDQVMRAAIREW